MNHITTSEDYARLQDGSTLVIQRWFPGSAERLWKYLVDAELRQKWLADGVLTPSAGSPLELVWRNDDLSNPGDPRPDGAGGEQRMQSIVVEASPPSRLVITWGSGAVEFDLLDKDGRVRLTITHSGLDASKTAVFAGWHTHLDILSALVENSAPPSFWLTWTRLHGDYQTRLNAASPS